MQKSAWIQKLEAQVSGISDEALRNELLQLADQAHQAHQRELEALKKRLAELQAQGNTSDASAYRFEAVLWTRQPPDKVGGPYCPDCYEADGELMALKIRRVPLETEQTVLHERWECPDCSASYEVVDPPPADVLCDRAEGAGN